MGYDLLRFTDQCDYELRCQICTMVLENPLETPCQHFFCDLCIKEWISIQPVCPVDRRPLTSADLKPPCRLICNLLGKLNIECDFHANGCPEIVRLDNLQNHRSACIYDPVTEVTCDKGCKLKMRRREYVENDCIAHFEKIVGCQREKISELTEEMKFQRQSADKVVRDLKAEISELTTKLNLQRESADRADKVISNLRAKIVTLEKLKQSDIQSEQFDKLELIDYRSDWQRCDNMKIRIDNTISLETDSASEFGLWQSAECLHPRFRPHFKLKILKIGKPNSVVMGVTRRGHTFAPPRYSDQGSSYGYRSNGQVVSSNFPENIGAVMMGVNPIGYAFPPPGYSHQESYGYRSNGQIVSSNFPENIGAVMMGVNPIEYAFPPPGYSQGSYGYRSNGQVVSSNIRENIGAVWKEGDVITCGILLGSKKAEIYFCRNDQKFKSFFVKQYTADGLFPTIYIHGLDAKWDNIYR